MSDEAQAFRDALNAAGQPWSRRGVRVAGGGIVALLVLQVIMMFTPRGLPYSLYILIALVGVIAVGWAMLIMAVLKRRRWARDQLIAAPPLGEPAAPGAS